MSRASALHISRLTWVAITCGLALACASREMKRNGTSPRVELPPLIDRELPGYGKKFLDAGNGQWGDKMQDDLTWGVKHLVAKGIADPARVAIFGIS